MYYHLTQIRYLFLPVSLRFLNISKLNKLHFTILNIQSTKLASVIILQVPFFFFFYFGILTIALRDWILSAWCPREQNDKRKCSLRSTGNTLGKRVKRLWNNTQRFRILGVCSPFSWEPHLLTWLPRPLICTRLCQWGVNVIYHQPLVYFWGAVTTL